MDKSLRRKLLLRRGADNGSEFLGEFAKELEREGMGMRFNRTLEEEFIELRELMRYLIWYSSERVHSGLGKVSPLEWICHKFCKNSPQSKILWTHP